MRNQQLKIIRYTEDHNTALH